MTERRDLADPIRKLIDGAIVGSPYAALLGIQPETIESDRVRLRLPFRQPLTTIGDTVHGGAIASLIDVAATAACWASDTLPSEPRGTTIGFSVNILTAARGADLVADARVIQRGKSICTCSISVETDNGDLVAQATVSYKLSGRASPDEALQSLLRGRPLAEQQGVLAQLERSGAALYRSWAEETNDADRNALLLEAARREDLNAESLAQGEGD